MPKVQFYIPSTGPLPAVPLGPPEGSPHRCVPVSRSVTPTACLPPWGEGLSDAHCGQGASEQSREETVTCVRARCLEASQIPERDRKQTARGCREDH